MTTLTQSPAAPAPTNATPTAAPSPRWLLRLHRPALYISAALFVVLAATLLVLRGPLTDSAAEGWRQYNACRSAPTCGYDQNAIVRYKSVYGYTTMALTVLPFLLAAWAGGSLVGRELESGTAHLAWTQGITPTRWLATKLAVPAVAVAAGTGVLVALHRLMWDASQGRIDTAKGWSDNLTLHTNGPTTVAFALTGLAAGALAALLTRRALPALLIALGVVGPVRVLADRAMPYLWPAVTRTTSLEEGYGATGISVEDGIVTSTGAHAPIPHCTPDDARYGCRPAYDRADAVGFFSSYHPRSHYWPLQATTTALVLVIAAALTAAAFILLRRSTATRGRTAAKPPAPAAEAR